MAKDKKVKIEGAAQKPKNLCLRKPENPKTAAPTPGIESIYIKFESTQDAAGSIETKDNLKIYSVVS